MMRMVFVNLPVRDLAASKTFFGKLGFRFDPRLSDDTTACVIVEENIFVMLLTQERFREFITDDIADTSAGTEVLTCLSADSRQEVDETVRTALEAGGEPWKAPMEYGPMYGHSFQDLDGHVWEVMYMGDVDE